MAEQVSDVALLAACITGCSLYNWFQHTPGLLRRRQYIAWRAQDSHKTHPAPAVLRDEVCMRLLYDQLKKEHELLPGLQSVSFPTFTAFSGALNTTPELRNHVHGSVPVNEGSGMAVSGQHARAALTQKAAGTWCFRACTAPTQP
jgi:hypothetical protein